MSFFNPVKNFSSRLTKLGNKEPIHFLSLAIIFALDIFVLFNLFQGLSFQTDQLTSPYEVVPYTCREYIDEDMDDYSVIKEALTTDSYFRTSTNKYASGARIIEQSEKDELDSQCLEIYEMAVELNNNTELQGSYSIIRPLYSKISTLESQNRQYERQYDTMLLENIAEQQNDNSLTQGTATTVRANIIANTREIDTLKKEITLKEQNIVSHPQSQRFLSFLNSSREEIQETLSTAQFWYPLKKVGMQMMFIFPLFLLFFWLYKKNTQSENNLLSLIFAHLVLVTLIPIILKVFELLLDVLPFHFFGDLLSILEALNIIALWNYILIILAIGLVLGLIYILQKKVFSSQRIWEKRIEKKKCWSCGKHKISEMQNHCGFCGEANTVSCPSCGEKTPLHLPHCMSCSADIS